MRRLQVLSVSLLVIISLLLVACAPAATPAPAATTAPAAATQAPAAGGEKIFKLGVMSPFTGPNARTGAELKGGVQMAFEAIDYKIGDYKVELVWVDEQSDPAKTSQAYEQAIVQDKIQACILNWHSSDAVAAMEISAKYKMPHFFGFGATELVNEKYKSDPVKYSYWFGKTWPSLSKLSIAYVTALEDAIKDGSYKPEAKTAYIYGEDTDLGRSFGTGIKKQFQDAGWAIVGEDYFASEQTEFVPLLNKVKGVNPAVLAGTIANPPTASALVKQADDIGLPSLIILDGLGWVGEWYAMTGKSSNYVLDQIPQFATAESQKFAADFKAKFNLDPSPSAAGHAYDMANFFIKIAKRAIEVTGELSTASLYKIGSEELFTGKLVYTEGLIHPRYEYNETSIPDPVVAKGYFIFPVEQYMDGQMIIVWPADVATGKLQGKPVQ